MRSNTAARILAVFLAIILWLFVTGDKITRTTPILKVWQALPLQVENLSPDYRVTEIPSSVDITLEGLPEFFEDLTLQDLEAYVDLSGKDPGSYLLPVQVRLPRGLNKVLLEPEQVRVTIETYHSAVFDLEVEIVGSPQEGWKLSEYEIVSEDVLIGAPESLFERIERVVLKVDLTDLISISTIEVPVEVYDGDGNKINGLLIDPAEVNVRLIFERIVEESS